MTQIVSQLYDRPGGNLILDMTGRVQNPRFATNARGFHDWSGFVPMTPGEAFRWYDFAAGHLVISWGGIPIYQGRVEDPEANGDPELGPTGLGLTCFGYSQAYSDVISTSLWSTQRLDAWEPVATEQLASRAPDRYGMSTDGALRIAPSSGEAFDNTHIGSQTFVIPHASVRQITQIPFDFEVKLPAGWKASLSRFTDAFAFQSEVWSATTSGTGTQTLTIAACDRLLLNLFYNQARTTLGTATNAVNTTLGTTTVDVNTTLGTTTVDVNTTLGTTIASGSRTVTPGSMTGITVGRKLFVSGTSGETITVASVTATTFTATFANAHTSADLVTLGTNTVTVTPASMTGITVGRKLIIGGIFEETVTVASVTGTTFTADFDKAHSSTDPVTLGKNSVTITPTSMAGVTPGVRLDIGGSKPEQVLVLATTRTTFTAEFVNAHATTDPVQLIGVVKVTPGSMAGITVGAQLAIGSNGGATRSQPETVTVLTTTSTTFTADLKYPHASSDTLTYVYTGETDVDCFVKLSNVRVKTTTSSIVDLSEIAASLVVYADAANPTQIDAQTSLIRATGFDLHEALFEDMYPADILDDLCAKGDSAGRRWEWRVWEFQRLRVQPEGTDSQTWYIDEAPKLLRSIDGIRNEAYGRYQDVSGRTKRTAVATDAGSLVLFGLRRRAAVDAQTTNLAEAELIRNTTIRDSRYNGSLGEFEIKFLRTVDGAVVPGWQCRAGDQIVVRGYPAGSAASIDYVCSFTVFATDWAYGQRGDRRQLGTLKIVSSRLPATLPGLLARRG